jgi:hypothetical protein
MLDCWARQQEISAPMQEDDAPEDRRANFVRTLTALNKQFSEYVGSDQAGSALLAPTLPNVVFTPAH